MTDDQKPEEMRIAKYLARAGVASRREIERMIEAGRITLNGEVLKTPAVKVSDADEIGVDQKPAPKKEPTRLWKYYKPLGLVTSASDEKGRRTIFEELPENLPRVVSVGRLDINSEGLLLLTNDGELKRKLELPSTGWLRRYRVRVKGYPVESMFDELRAGKVVDRELFAPMDITMDRQQGANAWLTIGLREGKYREVRRAMESIELQVNRLIRISYGPFQLGEMQPGEVQTIASRVMNEQVGIKNETTEAPQGSAPRKRFITRKGKKPNRPRRND